MEPFHNLKNLRSEYTGKRLLEEETPAEPFSLFDIWFQEAIHSEAEPNAMVLTTVSEMGIPSSRTMLLKEYNRKYFKFFTNYESKKARDIEKNPNVCILFFWKSLFRQVRIYGIAEKISKQESEEYFYSRPFESQISAYISKQSEIVENRKQLEGEFEKMLIKYKNQKVPFPENWGGYMVKPFEIEFWQGQPARLHDRIVYSRSSLESKDWIKKRLYP